MNTAEAHLWAYGYLGVSLEKIVREIGITKPSLYYHFPEGKEQLFVDIAHRAMSRTREGLQRAMSARYNGADNLRAAAQLLMNELYTGQRVEELRNVATLVSAEHRATLAESFYDALYGPIHSTIASAMESGEFREDDPGFLTWSFLALTSGIMGAANVPTGTVQPSLSGLSDVNTLAERTVDLFLVGVRT